MAKGDLMHGVPVKRDDELQGRILMPAFVLGRGPDGATPTWREAELHQLRSLLEDALLGQMLDILPQDAAEAHRRLNWPNPINDVVGIRYFIRINIPSQVRTGTEVHTVNQRRWLDATMAVRAELAVVAGDAGRAASAEADFGLIITSRK